MRLDWTVYRLELTTPLRISRSTMARRDAVRVVVSCDGHVGHGEVVTSVYYGLDVPRIIVLLKEFQAVAADFDDPAALLAALPEIDAPGVTAAVDAALHDLIGQRLGVPVRELVGSPQWSDTPTAYTIGISSPEQAARQAAALVARGFRVLKVKLGSEHDEAVLAAIRAMAPDARLLLDPNGGWSAEHTVRVMDRMSDYGVNAVEQPIAPGQLESLAWVSERVAVPVIADEDAATVADVRALAGAVAGVNIKLAKCGGLSAARELIAAAREGGMDVMLGCLVASSLGIAPAVHLSGQARWIDLDGHLLLAHDPWQGIGGEDGTLRLTDAPGLGVVAR
ncbi:dipeptide epimerase [Actinokineospora sp.]|uniref:dipeptide epimerase n=1 Tax=Actinokineospora sp. TaxID=1872133 RepID=UPI003D6BA1BB